MANNLVDLVPYRGDDGGVHVYMRTGSGSGDPGKTIAGGVLSIYNCYEVDTLIKKAVDDATRDLLMRVKRLENK